MSEVVSVHVIRDDGGWLTKWYLEHVPAVGDEVRIAEGQFYRVTLRVWCFDEGKPRCNLMVEPI